MVISLVLYMAINNKEQSNKDEQENEKNQHTVYGPDEFDLFNFAELSYKICLHRTYCQFIYTQSEKPKLFT